MLMLIHSDTSGSKFVRFSTGEVAYFEPRQLQTFAEGDTRDVYISREEDGHFYVSCVDSTIIRQRTRVPQTSSAAIPPKTRIRVRGTEYEVGVDPNSCVPYFLNHEESENYIPFFHDYPTTAVIMYFKRIGQNYTAVGVESPSSTYVNVMTRPDNVRITQRRQEDGVGPILPTKTPVDVPVHVSVAALSKNDFEAIIQLAVNMAIVKDISHKLIRYQNKLYATADLGQNYTISFYLAFMTFIHASGIDPATVPFNKVRDASKALYKGVLRSPVANAAAIRMRVLDLTLRPLGADVEPMILTYAPSRSKHKTLLNLKYSGDCLDRCLNQLRTFKVEFDANDNPYTITYSPVNTLTLFNNTLVESIENV